MPRLPLLLSVAARAATLLAALAFIGWNPAAAQISPVFGFDPPEISGLCGIAHERIALEPDSSHVWVYDCNHASIHAYAQDGTFIRAIPRPGESANDADLEIAPVPFTLAGVAIPAGTLLFINGETGTADIYALDKETGAILATLNTGFGASHVVGGAFHPFLRTFFLVQDSEGGTTGRNRVAEVDPVSGGVYHSFSIEDNYSVYYGDLDVSDETGNLFVMGSRMADIAEYRPDGVFVARYALNFGSPSNLSGIGLDCGMREFWGSTTSGGVQRFANVPCNPGVPGFDIVASGSPTTLPPGGTLRITAVMSNHTDNGASAGFWISVRQGATVLRNVNLAPNIFLPPNTTLTRQYAIPLPSNIPPGVYTVVNNLGRFPNVLATTLFYVNVTAPGLEVGAEPVTEGASVVAGLPQGLALHAAAPNPFATRTTLSYDVPEASPARLAVYDALGREVAVLADGQVEAGTHAALFDGERLPAGVYVARLTVGTRVLTQRLTLAR